MVELEFQQLLQRVAHLERILLDRGIVSHEDVIGGAGEWHPPGSFKDRNGTWRRAGSFQDKEGGWHPAGWFQDRNGNWHPPGWFQG